MTRLRSAVDRSQLVGAALAHPVRTLLLGYALSRLVVVFALWVAATWFQNPAGVGHLGPGVTDLIGLWDGTWYRRIAEHGYPVPLPLDARTGEVTYSAWAFYPAFPFLVRPLLALGIGFDVAGVAVNLILGGAATVLVWTALRSGVHSHPQPSRDRLALVSALLWCLYPATATLSEPYTEALAMVLVAGSIVLLMNRRYAWLSVTLLLLGLTRGVAPAMGLVVLVHLIARWREDRAAGRAPLAGHRVAAAGALVACGVSGLLWPAIAGIVTGVPGAFFDTQAAWGQRPGDGPFVLWVTWAWKAHGLLALLVLAGLVGSYLALIYGRHGNWLSAEIRAWAVAYPLYLVAVVRPITSMWRFLLLDFPIAALVASVATRTATGTRMVPHWRRRVAVLVPILAAGVVWWTAAMWVYTPWGSRPP